MKRGAVAVAAVVALAAAAGLLRRCARTDEDVLSDAVDDARSALVEGRRDDFLAFFADGVRYRGSAGRRGLERDVDAWMQVRLGRVHVLSRTITVDGDRAVLALAVDAGATAQFRREVAVDLEAERRDDGWRITAFDWR